MMWLDILFHKVPWADDEIKVVRNGKISNKFWIDIMDGAVVVQDGTFKTKIRRDLPRWSHYYDCWYYNFDDNERNICSTSTSQSKPDEDTKL